MATSSYNHSIIFLLNLSKFSLIYTAGSHKLHTDALNALQFANQHIMHQTASRNNLLQLAANMLCIIIYSNSMALAAQLPSSRQTCHTATNNADFLTSFLLWRSYLLISRQPAQIANLNWLINASTGTTIHTRIWADTAADRAWEWCIFQLQLNSFLHLALTQQIHATLGRNASRTAKFARSIKFCIIPAWYAETVQAVGNSIMNSKIIHSNITEDTALYPFLSTELLQRFSFLWLSLLFLKGQRTQFLPLRPIRQLCL